MPLIGIIKLRGQEDFLPLHTRRLDPLSDFSFVLVSGGSVNMRVSVFQGEFNSIFDLAGLGLPRAYICKRSTFNIQFMRWFPFRLCLPRPTVGMIAPVLSVTDVVAGMLIPLYNNQSTGLACPSFIAPFRVIFTKL